MRKIIKTKITKGILLFLFTFFSVGVQGQDNYFINFSAKPIINNQHSEYGNKLGYTLLIPAGLVSRPSDLTINVNINVNVPSYLGGSTPSYDWTDSSGYQYPDTLLESILNSIMYSYGSVWGTGDAESGSFVYEGGGGGSPPPCINTCAVGYILTPWCSCILESCDETLKTKINTLANNAIVKTQILAAQTAAKMEVFERSTVINKDPATTVLTSPGLGPPGTANSVGITSNATTQLMIHSHPDNSLSTNSSVYPTHSAGDIYALYETYKIFNSVQNSMTVGITHAYMLVVENPEQLTSFILSNPAATTLVPNSGDFLPGTPLDNDLENARKTLRNQGESIDGAYASAFAYFLKLHRTGIVLYESVIASDGSTNFQSKRTSSTITPAQTATPTTPGTLATTTYTKNDCP